MIDQLYDSVLQGHKISKQEALLLAGAELEPLCKAADMLRAHFCGSAFDLCTIINGKSGRCSEDCKYCAQSAFYTAGTQEYPLLNSAHLVADAVRHHQKGILRYSIVTSGRNLCDAELEEVCASYRDIQKSCGVSLCASHGLLSYEQFVRLHESGVTRYHNNLETSRRYFPEVCTTHTYEDKIEAIRSAQRAGLEVCSGGIIGMGETTEDRIDLALQLRTLEIRSVPINVLSPVKGTPFGHRSPLSSDELRRTAAVFRFLLPDAALRLAGGRGQFADKGAGALRSGINAAISGDMLTTSGISLPDDFTMIKHLGFEVRML